LNFLHSADGFDVVADDCSAVCAETEKTKRVDTIIPSKTLRIIFSSTNFFKGYGIVCRQTILRDNLKKVLYFSENGNDFAKLL